MAEGTVPNFNDVQRDLIALNKWPDRRDHAGIKTRCAARHSRHRPQCQGHPAAARQSGTEQPLQPGHHGTAGQWRLSYANLWQAGHTAGFSFQMAPERIEDAEVYSGLLSRARAGASTASA